jgi:hypothetical protein
VAEAADYKATQLIGESFRLDISIKARNASQHQMQEILKRSRAADNRIHSRMFLAKQS